jgi:hypothetical protein
MATRLITAAIMAAGDGRAGASMEEAGAGADPSGPAEIPRV